MLQVELVCLMRHASNCRQADGIAHFHHRLDKELLKDWIYEGVHAGKEISGEVLNWMTRGAGKNVQEVAGKIEEWFNSEGEVTMTKTTQMDKKTMK